MPVLDAALSPPVPGLLWGEYPERPEPADASLALRSRRPGLGMAPSLSAWQRRARAVQALAKTWDALNEADFDALRSALQARLAHEGLSPAAVDAACACVVQAAWRALSRRAFDQQVIAALCMLDNRLVELATGEGKSLATALAAALAALAGIPVHVLTANDYLVERDAQAFRPLFVLLGLDVATVVAGQPPAARVQAYQHPIVYATARELAFDYLRDRLRHGGSTAAIAQRLRAQALPPERRPLLRGLCFAIIDEADSVLIDDATMPLILSRSVRDPVARAFLWQAWGLSGRLLAGEHFQATPGTRRAWLTEAGRQELQRVAQSLPAVWKNTRHREETVESALTMRHLLHRDRDYLVSEGVDGEPPRIELIDAVTGRLAQGRRWSGGLHVLAAFKEGLIPEDEAETVSRITFQRFFRRYHRLAGMSGTLMEARAELGSLYGLEIVRVPSRLPLQRTTWPTRCFATDVQRWLAVVERAASLSAQGRPVLIGTDSVEASQQLSEALQKAGVDHVVLNARHDVVEASIVARAGEAGRVTVSTNMAGRGTDIVLSPVALAAGGLHVLCCQHNHSARHDRQLQGRSARQGEPGSCETWISVESVARAGHRLPGAVLAMVTKMSPGGDQSSSLAGSMLDTVMKLHQYAADGHLSRQRKALFKADSVLERQLAFCGDHTS